MYRLPVTAYPVLSTRIVVIYMTKYMVHNRCEPVATQFDYRYKQAPVGMLTAFACFRVLCVAVLAPCLVGFLSPESRLVCLCLPVSVCPSVCLPVSLSVCVYVCLSLALPLCLCLSVCLSGCLSICPSVCPSVHLSVCLSFCRLPRNYK